MGEYEMDNKYIIERDIFLIRQQYSLRNYYLIPEENYNVRGLGRHYSAPDSIKQYEENPEDASIKKIGSPIPDIKLNVVGIVRAGTKIKSIKVTSRKGWTFMYGSFQEITPYGEILTGPYAGKVVDIKDISIYYKSADGIFLYKPETGVLKALNSPNQPNAGDASTRGALPYSGNHS